VIEVIETIEAIETIENLSHLSSLSPLLLLSPLSLLKKSGETNRFPRLFLLSAVILEAVVEANGEEVQVVVHRLAVEADAGGEVVGVHAIGVDHVPAKFGNVKIEIHGEFVGELVVHAGNNADAESGGIVAILHRSSLIAVDVGVGGAFGAHAKPAFGFSKEAPIFPLTEVVASVGGNAELEVGGRHVGVAGSAISAGVVVTKEDGGTNLPVVVQLIADLGTEGEASGGGAARSVVVIVDTLMVETRYMDADLPSTKMNLFGETESSGCPACAKGLMTGHNGIKCVIRDWTKKRDQQKIVFENVFTEKRGFKEV
jgi:hypothetical protein